MNLGLAVNALKQKIFRPIFIFFMYVTANTHNTSKRKISLNKLFLILQY